MSDPQAQERLRLDKWLWFARFFKSRSLAAKMVTSGIRVDGTRVNKPSSCILPGQVLTFAQGNTIRVVRVVALGTRRGPAPEAQLLYEDLTPAPVRDAEIVPPAPRFEGKGRPGKKDRRDMRPKGFGPLE
ncbi:RNA-binding S4 domain-containing protein [Profundibacterium mesophilum]|uniref:Heat shock protein 15 n=1 Tax=Profundibacterium mesophilum KAUST100406-0324 TaxID=1037889 RepID=A0A921NP38_9RHOB|nr:RNA-binding S4 domain-containing protein [Profundibacterium mesophilum]KAF0674962.1 putative Heat shock protein 15 [Profundibacterium mesophilum KAUST100406-0324]